MATWNEFVAVLDQTIGFGNKVSSSVETISQWYDEQNDEHVTLLEYRIKVEKSPRPELDPALLKAGKRERMAFLRDLIADIERATRESERKARFHYAYCPTKRAREQRVRPTYGFVPSPGNPNFARSR